jgi:hypothetical protein
LRGCEKFRRVFCRSEDFFSARKEEQKDLKENLLFSKQEWTEKFQFSIYFTLSVSCLHGFGGEPVGVVKPPLRTFLLKTLGRKGH